MDAPARRPTILLITADQLRRDALGCYGERAVATPAIDALAAGGTVFDAAYTASPWCMPSRASLITGQYPRTHRVTSNFQPVGVDPAAPNLFGMLHGLGYTVTVTGKCHFGPVDYAGTRPDRTLPYDDMRDYYLSLGIDHLDLQDDKQVSVWFRDDYARELEEAGYLEAYRAAVWDDAAHKVFPFPGPAEWHPDRWVGRKTLDRIADAGEGPQLIWMSLSGPHFPFDPPEEYLDRVDVAAIPEPVSAGEELDADAGRMHHASRVGRHGHWIESGANAAYDADYWQRLTHHYLANVALIDDVIGEVVAAARARFGDDLVIALHPDHGEMLGNHGFWGKGFAFYEDVVRVPLVLQGDGVAAGARSDALVSLIDVLPTFLEWAGGEAPASVEGRSLLADDRGHALVWSEGGGFQTVTDGRHKLANATHGGEVWTELFDLDADPHELTSIAGRPESAVIERDLQAAAATALLDAALP